MEEKIKIVLTGGGTAGPVMPLIAIAQGLRERGISTDFLFIGTEEGPERNIAEDEGIKFVCIKAGKLRRYFSLKNLTDPFKIVKGMLEAKKILKDFKPNVVVSAGGFVAVPVIKAASSLKIPSLIHQQDVVKGLSNRLTQGKATKITVNFEKSLLDFPKEKVVLTGNPVRPDILKGDRLRAVEIFSLNSSLPTLLVLGGGTGAVNINQSLFKILPELVKFCQVIHLTGKGKNNFEYSHENYHQYEFLSRKMKHALAAADLIVSRAGLCALTEFSALGKPSIIIPIFKTHQEKNAAYFEKEKAVLMLRENILNPKILLETIKELILNREKLKEMGEKIHNLSKPNALDKIIDIILEIKK